MVEAALDGRPTHLRACDVRRGQLVEGRIGLSGSPARLDLGDQASRFATARRSVDESRTVVHDKLRAVFEAVVCNLDMLLESFRVFLADD